MSETSPPHPRLTHPEDAEIARYRAVSSAAVVGLILGLLSPLALVDPLLWLVPAIAIAVSALALRRIARRRPALIGRRAALAGLLLSMLLGVAALSDWFGYRWFVRCEAVRFADLWFVQLADDQPQRAYQLTLGPRARQPWDEKLWEAYRQSPRWRGDLEYYVSQPLVRALLALGHQAKVRYYQSAAQAKTDWGDSVSLIYAVTYEEDGGKKTFFVRLELERLQDDLGGSNFRLARAEGGVRPE
jgi:hypothetical protein